MTQPAYIRNGNQDADVIADFIEEFGTGDLIAVDYYCLECAEKYTNLDEDPKWWPAYSWPNGDTYCTVCGMLVNKGKE